MKYYETNHSGDKVTHPSIPTILKNRKTSGHVIGHFVMIEETTRCPAVTDGGGILSFGGKCWSFSFFVEVFSSVHARE